MAQERFTVIAGVEITQGQVGSLSHGEVDARHTYGDPVAAMRRWIDEGASWVHVGDLDAAAGTGSNAAVVARVLRECQGRVQVVLSGGIRDDDTLRAALATRSTQVVLDTAALADPDFVARAIGEHRHNVAAGINAHGTRLFAPGTPVDGTDALDALSRLDALGCAAYVINDVDSKGVRKQSGRVVLTEACTLVDGAVIAGGGITRLEDLHVLLDLVSSGLTGAIVDHALAAGAFTFSEAVAAVEPRFDLFQWGPPQP